MNKILEYIRKIRFLIISLKILKTIVKYSIILLIFTKVWEEVNDFRENSNITFRSPSNVENYKEEKYSENFSDSIWNIPYWVPVEKGMVSYWYDYTENRNFIFDFFKLSKLTWIKEGAKNSYSEYYEWHEWVDLIPTYSDKKKWYLPDIISTIKWIPKRVEYRENYSSTKYKYFRKLYENWKIYKYETIVKKSDETKIRPYWNHIIISSLDWYYYIMFWHLNSLSKWLYNKDNIKLWQVLWKMWNTWNSTWTHLHYEIRVCWENNNLKKDWNECKSINPMSYREILDLNNYWWFKEKVENLFTYWVQNIIESYVNENDINNSINDKYIGFCKLYKVNNNEDCKIIFSIVYQNESRDINELEKSKFNKEKIVNKYLVKNYWENIENISIDKINKISNELSLNKEFHNTEDFILELSNILSYWKFNNSNSIYLINNTIDNKDLLLNKQTLDLIKTIELMDENLNHEEKFLKYSYSEWIDYEENKNPYVYNFINDESMFLNIKNNQNEVVEKYSELWLLKIYNYLK